MPFSQFSRECTLRAIHLSRSPIILLRDTLPSPISHSLHGDGDAAIRVVDIVVVDIVVNLVEHKHRRRVAHIELVSYIRVNCRASRRVVVRNSYPKEFLSKEVEGVVASFIMVNKTLILIFHMKKE
jgi:hypothetical protein